MVDLLIIDDDSAIIIYREILELRSKDILWLRTQLDITNAIINSSMRANKYLNE
ncbi:hypothetical protein WN51_02526 [Melipona quadrifasciata]|uniref:Uncharacterized protein n=1 Tax=Melipona quadrifasciata TaxID=166423 RepID=A0A0M8ZSX4_9HYME|nr:hypothetical protein WN51_02526 [Melipona quadrifasciata]